MPKSTCIFEDKKYANFLPLSLSHPVFDLRIGCGTLRSRLLNEVPAGPLTLICRQYLAASVRAASPGTSVNEKPSGSVLFLNGRWLALGEEQERVLESLGEAAIAVKGGYVVAARLPAPAAAELADYFIRRLSGAAIDEMCAALRAASAEGSGESGSNRRGSRSPVAPAGDREDRHAIGQDRFEEKLPVEVESLIEKHKLRRVAVDDARLLSFPWQLIEFNDEVIADDFDRFPVRGRADDSVVYPGVHIVDAERVVVGEKSVIRSGTVLDATDGPIVIADHVVIMPNSTLVGPCHVGSGSIVNAGARVLAGTSIGAVCKIGGEVSETIFAAYANKQHDGFIGNSYIGEWVNLGAATNNSDLKNNYSPVRMWCAGRERETGRQFLGLLMGDHSKTGINTLFNTGTVIGFNCNVYSSELPGKFIPSFSWGHGEQMTRYDLERAMHTAAMVMERRNVRFTNVHRDLFSTIFDIATRAGWNV